TQYGSIAVAEDKARSALYFRRPSKVFEELVAQGGMNMRLLALRGASPLEGGIPLMQDGKIVGAIGVFGATSVQDGQVAKADADACLYAHPPRSGCCVRAASGHAATPLSRVMNSGLVRG